MELQTTIDQLRTEHGIITQIIAGFEELARVRKSNPTAAGQAPPTAGKRRGRKSMNARERQEVSERMKKYWKGRREQRERAGNLAEAVHDHFEGKQGKRRSNA